MKSFKMEDILSGLIAPTPSDEVNQEEPSNNNSMVISPGFDYPRRYFHPYWTYYQNYNSSNYPNHPYYQHLFSMPWNYPRHPYYCPRISPHPFIPQHSRPLYQNQKIPENGDSNCDAFDYKRSSSRNSDNDLDGYRYFMKLRRKRAIFTPQQLELMKKEFDSKRYLSSQERQEIAKQINVGEKQIKIWWQNRRNKDKNNPTSLIKDECILEKSSDDLHTNDK